MLDSQTKRRTAGAMPDTQTVHSAAPSFAGYLYQARLALAEALRYAYADSGVEIAVEKFDVSFEKNGTALELLQTKHRLTKAGDLRLLAKIT